MLALHLIQNCMVYINTLMIQKVLAQPHWQGRFTHATMPPLTPLIWGTRQPVWSVRSRYEHPGSTCRDRDGGW